MESKKNKNVPIEGGLSPSEIEKLKRKSKSKDIFLITVKHDNQEIFFWMKKVDMPTLSAVSSMADDDPMGSARIMFLNCLIKGDKTYADDVDVFPAIAEQLVKTMGKATSTLKKF